MNSNSNFFLIQIRKILLGLIVLLTLLFIPSCHKCDLIEQEITDPVIPCEGRFYGLKASPNIDLIFSLHEIEKAIPDPFVSIELAGPFFVPATLFDVKSNFSAFDNINNRYLFQHFNQFGQPNPIQFFSHDIASGISTYSSFNDTYTSPVFNNNTLYSILVVLQKTR